MGQRFEVADGIWMGLEKPRANTEINVLKAAEEVGVRLERAGEALSVLSQLLD